VKERKGRVEEIAGALSSRCRMHVIRIMKKTHLVVWERVKLGSDSHDGREVREWVWYKGLGKIGSICVSCHNPRPP
jgi:hypothetical protein